MTDGNPKARHSDVFCLVHPCTLHVLLTFCKWGQKWGPEREKALPMSHSPSVHKEDLNWSQASQTASPDWDQLLQTECQGIHFQWFWNLGQSMMTLHIHIGTTAFGSKYSCFHLNVQETEAFQRKRKKERGKRKRREWVKSSSLVATSCFLISSLSRLVWVFAFCTCQTSYRE